MAADGRAARTDLVTPRDDDGVVFVTVRRGDFDRRPRPHPPRQGGTAGRWGFAIYLVSKDGYEDSMLPTGCTAGSPARPWQPTRQAAAGRVQPDVLLYLEYLLL
jgi:hypothetical protein